jgi:hypothetical protein
MSPVSLEVRIGRFQLGSASFRHDYNHNPKSSLQSSTAPWRPLLLPSPCLTSASAVKQSLRNIYMSPVSLEVRIGTEIYNSLGSSTSGERHRKIRWRFQLGSASFRHDYNHNGHAQQFSKKKRLARMN